LRYASFVVAARPHRRGIVALIALGTAIGHGQLNSSPVAKAMIRETALPPIDRGLRDQDPPRAARTRDDANRIRSSQGDTLAYVRGSIIVKFKDDATRGAITAATAQVAGTIADRSSWADFDIVDIPTDVDPEAAAAAMRARPDVEYAQPRYRNHAMARPNDTLYGNQWNFPAIDMERAWDIQPGASAEIIVAVLDSGMAFQSGSVRYISRFPFRVTPTAVSRAWPMIALRRPELGPAARRGSRRRAISSERRSARRSRRITRRGHDRTTDEQRLAPQRPTTCG
jgi:hypothetical protein